MSGTSAPARTPAAGTAPSRRRRGAALAWAAGSAAACLALFACYWCQSRTAAVGSDGASQALQAWDLAHGNPLLRGWWMTDVSFYTTELPQYALIELARGRTADVIHLAGALSYTLLVLAAALLARGGKSGPGGRARALITAGIMLAPPLGPGTQTLLLSPDHTGTCVPVLLVFLLIDRRFPAHHAGAGHAGSGNAGAGHAGVGRAGAGHAGADRADARRWAVPVLVWLALTWAAVADAMTIFVAVIPLAAGCAARLLQGRLGRPGAWLWQPGAQGRLVATTTRGRPGDAASASLAAAALLAVPGELAVTALIRAHGGWQVNGLRTALAAPCQLAGNARLAGHGLLELFGADVFAAPAGVAAPAGAGALLAAVHLAGAALATAGLVGAARGFFRRAELIEQVLLIGIAVDLVAYLAGVQAVDILSTREIVPVLPFAAVLAGRRLAPLLTAPRRLTPPAQPSQPAQPAQPSQPALRLALCAVLALYAAGLGYAAAQPAAASQDAGLGRWLRAHRLTAGLSGYHQANIVTLATGGAVTLRPVTAGPGGRLAAYQWNASSAWFDPARATATFLVLTTPSGSGLTAARAAATFGQPARRYRYRQYTVLLWPGENLLKRLAKAPLATGTPG